MAPARVPASHWARAWIPVGAGLSVCALAGALCQPPHAGRARELWTLLSTGPLHRPDTLAVCVGGVGHCVLLVGCIAAFHELPPHRHEWRRFVVGGVLALAYVALIVATLLPR